MDRNKDDQKSVDPITVHLGDMGKFQFWFVMLIFGSKVPAVWIALGHLFLGAPTKYYCTDPKDADPCSAECKHAEHDRSVFEATIVTEFDLVCDRAWLSSLTQTIVMLGIMCGSMAFGIWADRNGRRIAFLTAVVLEILSGLLVSAAPTFWIYAFLRFLASFATGGIMVTGFLLIMELLGANMRESMSILYQLPFTLGHASLALFSYFFRDWRWANFSYMSIALLYLVSLCLCIESPRWLFTTGRLDEAITLMERIARSNGMPTENIRPQVEEAYRRRIAQSPTQKGNMGDLFRTPNLRKKTLVLLYMWFDVCMVYYGVSQYISTLSGNIFINVAASGLVCSVMVVLCTLMLRYVGRRACLIGSNFVIAICLLALALFPHLGIVFMVSFSAISVGAAMFMFCIIYLYSGELFPTVVRNTGVGLCSFMGRVGSMIAPQVSDLQTVHHILPPLVFGACCLIGGLLMFLLPETKGITLPETIQEGEDFGKKPKT